MRSQKGMAHKLKKQIRLLWAPIIKKLRSGKHVILHSKRKQTPRRQLPRAKPNICAGIWKSHA